jgi:large subunit ribosomal protein L18
MNRLKSKAQNAFRRAHRVKKVVRGTPDRPRLTVTISNRHISAQVIDDIKQQTIVSATTIGQKNDGTMTERAEWLGKEIVKKAKAKKVKRVAFDRGSRLYHGRIKAVADAARKEGLEL